MNQDRCRHGLIIESCAFNLFDLSDFVNEYPDRAAKLWERVKETAQAELRHPADQAVYFIIRGI